MTDERLRFDTAVPGIWGYWPITPSLWSYSSLKEIEACPRRWMLSRSDYPDIWARSGYPMLPSVAAIFGSLVHRVTEQLTKALATASNAPLTAGDVVEVLSALGGWRGIVLAAIEQEMARFDDNPRVSAERMDRVRSELTRRAPEVADRAKALLTRLVLTKVTRTAPSGVTTPLQDRGRRLPAGNGVHAERTVTAERLRLTGTIDQLVVDESDVTVTDFKTGLEDEAHEDQLRLYALLWRLDETTNPAGRPATKLRVAYPSYDRPVEAPDATQLKCLEAATAARVAAADQIANTPPPTATPSAKTCQFCTVKHLCDAYWRALPRAVAEVSPDEWFDFEGFVIRRNGSRSWVVETMSHPASEVLIRTFESNLRFPVGERVRLLGVRRSQNPDQPGRLIVSMVATSEWYPVRARQGAPTPSALA